LTAESINKILEIHPKPDLVYRELSKIRDEKDLKEDPLLDDLLKKTLEKVNAQKG